MSRYNRNKLSRGTRLVSEHLNTGIRTPSLIVAGGFIAEDQIGPNESSFYVNWNIPVIRSSWGETNYEGKIEVPFPFVLPPTQDNWSDNKHTNEKALVLEEIMFSFDQNGNALAVTDYFDTLELPGLLYDGVGDNYTIRLRLYEKTPFIVSGEMTPENMIYQVDLDAALFNSTKYRSNPVVQSDLTIPINPYKSYIMTLSFPTGLMNTYSGVMRSAMLPSTNVRLKLASQLLRPDMYYDITAQNIPSHLGLSPYVPGNTVTAWSPGDPIYAEDAGGTPGIQTSIESIDYLATKGYRGGLDTKSNVLPNNSIQDFYGYDVICLPLFQGLEAIRRGMITDGYEKNMLPYVLDPSADPTWTLDRRMIHISHPFIIHHVFCSMSFYANQTALQAIGNHASSHYFNAYPGTYRYDSDILREVGVFIGTGIRSEHQDIQQVAYCEMNIANSQYLVDKVQLVGEKGNPAAWGSISNKPNYIRADSPDSELWSVPINYDQSRTGFGFDENGPPFFTGQGELLTQSRTNAYDRPFDFGGGAGIVPRTKGQEQWIEVRGKISDTGGLGRYPLPADEGFNDIVIGKGGWYVYLIGKRALSF